ncbi:hypothetical protein OOK36_31260 [Streptomyces sp. NBC_00365]|uniref:hypothetical protein n=1 Tax=Streptomyces sp. NBC_00365 TaxID=2975726 RepID=UPI002254E2E7|nr:hypothetical protein [Streptomyces sp. NBC_00365]MCX5093289.1 hypothetical protein [Streptomyces sp. NBC_00365]
MVREPDKKIDESEFLDIAKDPAEARALRKALEQLASGSAGGVLKEMSQEVLSGRIGLREASSIPVYVEAASERSHDFLKAWDEMSEQERAAKAAEGEGYLGELRREMADERGVGAAEDSGKSRHSGKGWSLY